MDRYMEEKEGIYKVKENMTIQEFWDKGGQVDVKMKKITMK